MFLVGAFICELCELMANQCFTFYKKTKQKFLYPNDDYLLTMVVVMMMVASAYD